MDEEEIKRLRELCEKATPGPWSIAGRPPCVVTNPLGPDHETVVWGRDGNQSGLNDNWNDLSFIAAARGALPALLDEVERLNARLAKVERERIIAVCLLDTTQLRDYQEELGGEK